VSRFSGWRLPSSQQRGAQLPEGRSSLNGVEGASGTANSAVSHTTEAPHGEELDNGPKSVWQGRQVSIMQLAEVQVLWSAGHSRQAVPEVRGSCHLCHPQAE
jgi:hypothetical protein